MNIMKRRILLFAVIALCILPANGQEEKKWSLQTGFGEINMQENKYDEGDHFVSEDQGNAFYYTHGYRQKTIDIIGAGKACGQMNYLQMKTPFYKELIHLRHNYHNYFPFQTQFPQFYLHLF